MGITPHKLPKHLRRAVVNRYMSGEPNDQIAAAYGISASYVRVLAKMAGIRMKVPNRLKKGQAHEVACIVAFLKSGAKRAAYDYKISYSRARAIYREAICHHWLVNHSQKSLLTSIPPTTTDSSGCTATVGLPNCEK